MDRFPRQFINVIIRINLSIIISVSFNPQGQTKHQRNKVTKSNGHPNKKKTNQSTQTVSRISPSTKKTKKPRYMEGTGLLAIPPSLSQKSCIWASSDAREVHAIWRTYLPPEKKAVPWCFLKVKQRGWKTKGGRPGTVYIYILYIYRYIYID